MTRSQYRIIEPTMEKFEELAAISFNLMKYSKIWKEHYGALNRMNMNNWELKMQVWLDKNTEKIPQLGE